MGAKAYSCNLCTHSDAYERGDAIHDASAVRDAIRDAVRDAERDATVNFDCVRKFRNP